MTVNVTTVTRNASQDALTDAAYIGIIDSLRGPLYGWSWQRIADETGYNSKAWWALVAKGERSLDDAAKNALRRLTDGELPEQPPSVTDVTQRMVHPDAEMVLVGTLEPGERVRRVLMLAQSDVVLYVNGTVSAEPLQAPICDSVTPTGMVSLETQSTGAVGLLGANRAPSYRPKFSIAERDELEALGGIRAVLEAGKRALREATND